MFGAIGDSAPDRWGRALMRRMERRRAEHEKQTPRTLHEIDYLLLVDDEARAGALRFAERRRAVPAAGRGEAHTAPGGAARIAVRGGACHGRHRHRGGSAAAVCAGLFPGRRAAQSLRQGEGRTSGDCEVSAQGRRNQRRRWEAVALRLRRKQAFRCPARASKPLPTSRCCCCAASTGRARGAFRFSPR